MTMFEQKFKANIERGKDWILWIGDERWAIHKIGNNYQVLGGASLDDMRVELTRETLEEALYGLLDSLGIWVHPNI